MTRQRIYVIHPNYQLNPAVEEWLCDVQRVVGSDEAWNGWELFTFECDAQCSLNVRDVHSVINEKPGPILIVRPVQRRVIDELQRRLSTRTVIRVFQLVDSTDLYEVLERVRVMHDDGEPLLPQKFVLALLVMSKLDAQYKWAGNNAKGFMWATDISKGRGVEERFSVMVPGVLNELLNEGLLVAKRSQGRNKFALNPDRREEIYKILRERNFQGERIARILSRDSNQCSARCLDELPDYIDTRE